MAQEVRVAAVNLDVSGLWRRERRGATSGTGGGAGGCVAALTRLARQAAAEGAQLVLFPALSGMVFTAEGAEALRRWGEGGAPKTGKAGEEAEVAAAWRDAACAALGELARELDLHLVAGWLAEAGEEGRFRHETAVIGPDGAVLGRQAQTHATRKEAAQGLATVDRLTPIETALGRLGVVAGTDAWYPEVSRILALSGADVLLFPEAVAGAYPFWRQVAGAWQEVQQNQVFGVESGLAGGPFRGRAAIFGPCELTPGQTGQLAGVGIPYGAVTDLRQPLPGGDEETLRTEALVLADLDFGRLAEVRRSYPIFAMLNPGAYQHYFPGVYDRPAGEGNGA
ncbi:MAG TPA: hypothetical protein GXX28_07115 [Firmicutes bacterium]|nr:hypothetical protein [Bacillota bacterium]